MGNIKNKKFAKLIAGAALLTTIGIFGTACSSKNSTTSTPKFETVLNLMRNENNMPVHVEAGEYQLYITEQFVNDIKSLTNETKKSAVDGIKKAVEEFNTYSSNIKFSLAAEDESYVNFGAYPATKASNAISVYIERDKEGDASRSDIKCDQNGKIIESSVTFNREYLFGTWVSYNDLELLNQPENTYARTIAEHQLMHLIGFEDTKGPNRSNTITRYDLSKQTKEFTDYDKWTIAQYNYEFANGAKPEAYNNSVDELGM